MVAPVRMRSQARSKVTDGRFCVMLGLQEAVKVPGRSPAHQTCITYTVLPQSATSRALSVASTILSPMNLRAERGPCDELREGCSGLCEGPCSRAVLGQMAPYSSWKVYIHDPL